MPGDLTRILKVIIVGDGKSAEAALASIAGASSKTGAEVDTLGGRLVNVGAKTRTVGSSLTKGVTLPLLAVGAVSVKMAADFQSSMNLLVTAGGESESNLKAVSAGILNIAKETGTSTKQLAEGMYTVEKAGMRGADGLRVLRAAAEGAAAENVDLATFTNALTSVMTSYHAKAGQAVSITNELVAAGGSAKTTMALFAGSLSTVLPIASAAGISFAQVSGAIATLTQHGTSADEATQELSNTIRNLQAPNQVAQKEMQALGLDVNDVSKNLGKRGLTGTLDLVQNAIISHMGPASLVLQKSLNQSKTAAQDARTMITTMPPALAKLASGFLDGSVSLNDWRKGVRALPADQAGMATQFYALANRAGGFNELLKSGSPQAETYNAALKKIMGGATGLNTALQLSGENMDGFKSRVDEIDAAGKKNGKDISTWAKTQQTFNQQLKEFKQQISVTAIELGTALLPALKNAMNAAKPLFSAIESMARAFSNAPGPMQKAITYLALFAAGVGPVTYAIGGTITGVGRLVTGFGTLAGGTSKGIGALSRFAQSASRTARGGQALQGTVGLLGGKFGLFARSIGSGTTGALTKFGGAAKQAALSLGEMVVNAGRAAGAMALTAIKTAAATVAMVASKVATVAVSVATKIWAGIQWLLDAALDANPIGLIVIAIAALVAGIIYAYTHFKTFHDIVNLIGSVIKNQFVAAFHMAQAVVGAVVGFIRDHWKLLLAIIAGPLVAIGILIMTHWTQVKAIFQAGWSFVKTVTTTAINGVRAVIVAVFNAVKAFLTSVVNGWKAIIVAVWNSIKASVKAGVNAVLAAVRGVGAVATTIKNAFHSAYSAVSGQISAIIGLARGIGSRVVGAVGGLGSALYGAGKAIIQGLINGFNSMLGSLKGALSKVTNFVKDHKGPPSYDAVMLAPAGQSIMQGLIDGMAAKTGALKSHLQGVTATIARTGGAMTGVALPGASMDLSGASMAAATGGNTYVAVTVQGTVTSERDLIRKIRTGITDAQLRAGKPTTVR